MKQLIFIALIFAGCNCGTQIKVGKSTFTDIDTALGTVYINKANETEIHNAGYIKFHGMPTIIVDTCPVIMGMFGLYFTGLKMMKITDGHVDIDSLGNIIKMDDSVKIFVETKSGAKFQIIPILK